ncbi:OmpA family protein [Acidithiobacillus sp. CV18-2]|uniref:OmpA family protein n=1 Tax=Igneacidithiobacillus copahuensis TaxID=2724909 RepID=A0AAE2YQ99_9PROT|nr:OmpA family protein [Igneacidithiobacillus copahuensis]MBU2755465.1 OmpA family protein [Acidithiobacillus sp. CV18-3]MBU2757889.1 OmpA family protein [Acidithiobacillus sp. BN09-2]MBU2778191.1 OmpA family protein [Acidithiobacillus sp. CV18-2]MBU2797014.1 OmpA family protein [Acidithiobacillus sp. VAN18-2]MBU2800544.1 OmpA family protein [Acidithiobacillus sp. VAN18-4]UTV80497.1 OmpA family protein [Acidithiobacillus sp. YTS05]
MKYSTQFTKLMLLGGAVALSGCGLYEVTPCPAGPAPVAPVASVMPPPPPPPAPIAPVERTVLESKPITITGINFQTNSAKLMSRDIRTLDEVADFSKKHPEAVLHVNGYCSKTGSYAYNYKLSKARAASVAAYLAKHGVSPSKMSVTGHSYEDPIASNATPAGRFANQRVEINSSIMVKTTVK